MMKRPFAFTGAAALAVSFAVLYGGSYPVILLIFILIAFYAVLFLVHKGFRGGIISALVLAVLLFNALYTLCITSTEQQELAGKSALLEAVVIEEPEVYENSVYYTVYAGSDSCKSRMKLRLYSDSMHDIQAGDRIRAKVSFYEISDAYKAMNDSERFYVGARLETLEAVSRPDFSFYAAAASFRQYIKDTILSSTDPENGAALAAVVTGDKSRIDDETYVCIRRAGVSHIMAVSGLHLGIVCGTVLSVLKHLHVNRRTAAVIGMLSVLLVVIACGFQISAIRAAITYTVMLAGMLLCRERDSLNSLGFAVTLMVAVNPFIAGSVSFLLSISATFGIIVLAPLLREAAQIGKTAGRLRKAVYVIEDSLIISMSALLCTLPISVWYFGYLSVMAPLANLAITYAVSTALLLTVSGLVLSVFPITAPAAYLLIFLAGLLSRYFMSVIRFLGSSDFAVLYFGRGMSVFFVLFEAALLIASYTVCRRRKRKDEQLGVE